MSTLLSIKSKIIDFSETRNLVSKWKSEGKSVVFTNGCFDVLHYGHVSYLAADGLLDEFHVVERFLRKI